VKILFVAPHFYPAVGGVEKYVLELVRALSREHSVVVVTSGNEPQKSLVEGVKVYHLPYKLRLSNTPIGLAWYWRLRKIIRAEQPDVINAHSPVPFMADMAALAAGKVPVLLTYHAGSMAKGTGGLVDGVLKLYETAVLPRLFARVQRVAAVYPTFVQSKMQGIPTPLFIPPGIDTALFRPNSKAEKTVDIMFAGRIQRTSAWKGLDVLLAAVALLKKRGRDVRVQIAGDGDAVEEYRQQAIRLGIEKNVLFLGALHGDELVQAYQRSKVFVLPSKTEAESFGMVLAEAMACGVVVVGSRVGGVPNLVQDGASGRLVPPGNEAALAEVLRELLADAAQREVLGQAARQRVQAQFSLEHLVAQTTELFERTARPAIVHVVANYPPRLGGMEKVAEQLATQQYQSGHNVRVLTSRLGYDQHYKDSVPVTRLPAIEIAHTPLLWGLGKQLRRVQKRDLVHVHVAQAFVPEMVWLAAKLKGYAYIAHVHLDIAPSGAAGVLLKIYKPLVLGRVLRAAKYVVVFTPEQKALMMERYRLPSSRVRVVANGVDETFYHDQPRALHTVPQLLFVGRLSTQKNVGQLLRALQGISHTVETHIVGDGELRAEHEALAASLQLQNVQFHGRLDGEPLREMYRQADIFVLPSQREGMPLVLLEALAGGLPIVGTDVTGIRDMVAHGENGLLVPLGDDDALRRAIVTAVGDASMYQKMSNESLKKARQYSWPVVAQEFQELYDA